VGADTTDNGTFRFLTQSLPAGTTNAEYVARFVTANADGPVTFSALSALPPGLTLDALSGFLTGIPTATFNETITVSANDSTQQIQFDVTLKISAAGGGGNGGASFGNTSLADGRVGTVYLEQLTSAGGVGPFTFGAKESQDTRPECSVLRRQLVMSRPLVARSTACVCAAVSAAFSTVGARPIDFSACSSFVCDVPKSATTACKISRA
jgi:hypothetical protein